MAEHMRPFLERAIAFQRREVAAGRLREHDPVELMQLVYGAVSTYFSDAGFRARMTGEDPMTPEGRARFARRAHRDAAGRAGSTLSRPLRKGSLVDRRVRVAGAADRCDDLALAARARARGPARRPRGGRGCRGGARAGSGKPSARTACSARSIWRERLRVDRPCRRGCVRRGRAWRASRRSGAASSRASARTCSLVTSISGCWTSCSAAALRPGRQSPWSSALAPESSARAGVVRGERVVELGLAEVAAVAAVGDVAGARELVGAHDLVGDADVARDALRAVELALRDARARRR